jgi:hypothetical protein
MPPPPRQKSENVLKWAHGLMGVGQAQAALVLHWDVIIGSLPVQKAVGATLQFVWA